MAPPAPHLPTLRRSHNAFAAFYSLTEDEERLAHHIRSTEGFYSDLYWQDIANDVHARVAGVYERLS